MSEKNQPDVTTVTLPIARGPVFQGAVVASPLGGWLSLPLDKAHVFLASCREQAGRVH